MVAAGAEVAGAAAVLPGAATRRRTTPRLPQPPARRRGWPVARATANRARIIRGHACDNSRSCRRRSQRCAGANPYLLLTLTPLFWACNWIVGRGLAADVPPMAMTFLRWLFAILILAPFAWPHVRRDWPIVRRSWKIMAVPRRDRRRHAQRARLPRAQLHDGDRTALILNSFIPVMIITLSWIFLRERLSAAAARRRRRVARRRADDPVRGEVVEVLTSFTLNGGDLLLILAMAMWSIYTIGLRWRPAGLHDADVSVRADGGRRPRACCRSSSPELAFGRHMVVTPANVARARHRRALLVGARVHLLEPGRRAGRAERRRACSST